MLYLSQLILSVLIFSCRQEQTHSTEVLASTSIVADIVRQVAGPNLPVAELLTPGSSVHQFEPSPRQMIQLRRSGLIFLNGAGLEALLLKAAAAQIDTTRLVDLSADLNLRKRPLASTDDDHHLDQTDPHVWTDPNLVREWLPQIARRLSELYPADSLIFQKNARIYSDSLIALDQWLREQVARVPVRRRILLTDHLSLGYFADRYGFRQVGALVPAFSDLAEPTARDLARLQIQAKELKVPAVFVDHRLNKNLARQFAEDSNLRLVPLLMGSLSPEAKSYTAFIRYNVSRICGALKE